MHPFPPKIFPILLIPDLVGFEPTWNETPLAASEAFKHLGFKSPIPCGVLPQTAYRFKPASPKGTHGIDDGLTGFPNLNVRNETLIVPSGLQLWLCAITHERRPIYLRVQSYSIHEGSVPPWTYGEGIRVIPDYHVFWVGIDPINGIVKAIHSTQVPAGVNYADPMIAACLPKSSSVFVLI